MDAAHEKRAGQWTPLIRKERVVGKMSPLIGQKERRAVIGLFVIGMIYELDNYVAFFKEKTKDLISQLTKRLGQSYLLFILNSSKHSLEVFLSLLVLVHLIQDSLIIGEEYFSLP